MFELNFEESKGPGRTWGLREQYAESQYRRPDTDLHASQITNIMKPMKPSEVMDKIFEYPGIYIGHESVTRTQFFISGYIFALQQIGSNTEDHFQEAFSAFVCRTFGYVPTTHSWVSICVFHSPNENEAFELARKLWDQYKAEMNQDSSEV